MCRSGTIQRKKYSRISLGLGRRGWVKKTIDYYYNAASTNTWELLPKG